MCHFKDKSAGSTRMCAADRAFTTTDHVNQNGHVVKQVTSVIGVVPCIVKTKGAYKCRKQYKRNPRKPLQPIEVL